MCKNSYVAETTVSTKLHRDMIESFRVSCATSKHAESRRRAYLRGARHLAAGAFRLVLVM